MLNINIGLSSDLTFNGNKISILRSNAADNAFELKDDGIYLSKSGNGTNDGFADYPYDYFRIGFASGYDKTVVSNLTSGTYPVPGRVSAHNCVHRTFTASDNTAVKPEDNGGVTVPDFRPEIDCYKPGDFIRIPRENNQYEYFIITQTTKENVQNANAGAGNKIFASISLGTW